MKQQRCRRELSTRATRLPPPRAKAFQRKRSFFSILKKAAACPRRITLICTLGLAGSQKPAIVLARTVPECPSKKNRAPQSQPRTTSARMLPRRISFISFSTMSARLRPAAPFRKIRRRQRPAEFLTRALAIRANSTPQGTHCALSAGLSHGRQLLCSRRHGTRLVSRRGHRQALPILLTQLEPSK